MLVEKNGLGGLGGHVDLEVKQLKELVSPVLRIGEATVKTHLLNIYSKLGVSERTSAVTTALRLGLIGLEDTQD